MVVDFACLKNIKHLKGIQSVQLIRALSGKMWSSLVFWYYETEQFCRSFLVGKKEEGLKVAPKRDCSYMPLASFRFIMQDGGCSVLCRSDPEAA